MRERELRERQIRQREQELVEQRRVEMEQRERARVMEELALKLQQSRQATQRTKVNWERIESRMKQAVKAGELGAEEAKERLAEIKRRLQQSQQEEESDDDDDDEDDEDDDEDD